MPACCRCNGSGRCTNCCCKKAGRFCNNCLPSHKNHCGNQAPSEPNRVYPGHSSSAENRTDTADDLERTPNPPPAVTIFEPVDVPTLPTMEESNEAQIENPIVNPMDMLPPYTPISPIDPSYKWGSAEGSVFRLKVVRCYDEVVHWRRNVFSIPSGKAGKGFVSEMARLYQAYAEGSQIESLTLTAGSDTVRDILHKKHPPSRPVSVCYLRI